MRAVTSSWLFTTMPSDLIQAVACSSPRRFIVSMAIVSMAIVSVAIVSMAIVSMAIVSMAIVSMAIVSVAIVSIAPSSGRCEADACRCYALLWLTVAYYGSL